MYLSRKLLAGVIFISLSQASNAAIVSSTLENVSILGTSYNVTFWASDDSSSYYSEQSYESLSSYGNALEFTTSSAALSAIEAILAAITDDFDINPGASFLDGFRVAYYSDDTIYSAYTTYNSTTTGPYNYSVTQGSLYSLVTFEEAPVPLPASAWLMLSGLGTLSLVRRKTQKSI